MDSNKIISTEKKLQLIKMLRSEDETNRGLLRNREEILYGRGASYAQSYDAAGQGAAPGVAFTSIRLRFLAAFLLLVAFISWDRGYYPIPGIQPEQVYETLSRESSLTNLFDFTGYIPYTLN